VCLTVVPAAVTASVSFVPGLTRALTFVRRTVSAPALRAVALPLARVLRPSRSFSVTLPAGTVALVVETLIVARGAMGVPAGGVVLAGSVAGGGGVVGPVRGA